MEGTDLSAVVLSVVNIVHELVLIVRVSTLLNDLPATLARSQATEIRQTLLSDNDIKVVLSLINVSGKRHDASDTSGVSLALTS